MATLSFILPGFCYLEAKSSYVIPMPTFAAKLIMLRSLSEPTVISIPQYADENCPLSQIINVQASCLSSCIPQRPQNV